MLQIGNEETVIWSTPFLKNDDKNYYVTCSVCEDDVQKRRKAVHEQSHKGGTRCARCGHLGFSLTAHNCVPNEAIFIVKNGKIEKSFGHAATRVFAIPMQRNDEKILWIGSSCKSTAPLCAKLQHRQSLAAKEHNYVLPNGNSMGCPSYCKLVFLEEPDVQPFISLFDEAFFLNCLVGSYNSMRKLRNLCRLALKTSSHIKGRNGIVLYQVFHEEIFSKMEKMPQIPTVHIDTCTISAISTKYHSRRSRSNLFTRQSLDKISTDNFPFLEHLANLIQV